MRSTTGLETHAVRASKPGASHTAHPAATTGLQKQLILMLSIRNSSGIKLIQNPLRDLKDTKTDNHLFKECLAAGKLNFVYAGKENSQAGTNNIQASQLQQEDRQKQYVHAQRFAPVHQAHIESERSQLVLPLGDQL